MDAIQLALKVLDALETSRLDQSTAPPYPWLAVGHEIITPWQLIGMTDDEINRPEWDTKTNQSMSNLFWSMRAYARPTYRGEVLFVSPHWDQTALPVGIILFWPPRKVGYPPESMVAYGTAEKLLDVLRWLHTQDLPIHPGARRPMYLIGEWQGKHKSQPIEPTPMWETDQYQF